MALAGGVVRRRAPADGLPLPGGGHPLAGRALPRLRRAARRARVAGSGVGVVVLKRLADALRRRRHDPRRHPRLGHQQRRRRQGRLHRAQRRRPGRRSSREALAVAGVQPDDHRLRRGPRHRHAARRSDRGRRADPGLPRRTDARGFCALGSVKTQHRPPGRGRGRRRPHQDGARAAAPASSRPACTSSGPTRSIDFAASPFFVNAALRPWPRGAGRRGAPASAPSASAAPTPTSFSRRRRRRGPRAEPRARLAAAAALGPQRRRRWRRRRRTWPRHLGAPPGAGAWPTWPTRSQVGRAPLRAPPRRWCAATPRTLGAALAGRPAAADAEVAGDGPPPPVAFLFPGQGAQYVGMGREPLRDRARLPPARGRAAASCCTPHLGLDLRTAALPRGRGTARRPPRAAARRRALTQPALFAVEYALARLWMDAGACEPTAMLGHSLGEYVAACLAGVFSLEDALALVALRGRLMQRMPPGAMLAVALPEAELRAAAGRAACRSPPSTRPRCAWSPAPPRPSQALQDELAPSAAWSAAGCTPRTPSTRR